ncbi:MAG: hypothetical protein JSU87_17485 [Gemmatimonadota bacterium]|nr:MAG: hypothetical protein JSU87_17485 [Gemmatimonadota bacterium]
MRADRISRRQIMAGLLVSGLASWGCVEYTVETTINPDGSGLRSETMEVDENEDVDFKVSADQFRVLMHVDEAAGWKYEKATDDEGKVLHVLRRQTEVGDLTRWSSLDRRIHISAATSGSRGAAVGDPRYSNVAFWNRIEVRHSQSADGKTFSYRERFYWENLMGVLIDLELERFKRSLTSRFPDLDPELRGELIGLAKGGLWTTAQQGRWDMGEADRARAFQPLSDHLVEEALRLARTQYANADESFFGEAFRDLFVGDVDDEEVGRFLEEKLPGVMLAGNSELVLRLSMPGQILESNAHERDGSTLVWKFSPWDAIVKPVEPYAESIERD